MAQLASTDPSDIATAARCFSCNITGINELAVRTYLLTQLGNVATPPCITPTAPTFVQAKSVGPNNIFITWRQLSNSGSFITSYTIQWGTVSGVYTNSATVPVIPRAYSITGLTSGTKYFFVVKANSSAAVGCSSANSSEGNATTSGAAPSNGLLNNLISYWNFDALTAPDQKDGHDLTLSGAGSGVLSGILNTSLGIGVGNSFAGVTGGGDFSMGLGVSFTFSLWVFTTNAADINQCFIFSEFDNNSLANSAFWLVHTNVPPVSVRWIGQDTGGNLFGVNATSNFTDNTWAHIVCGFDAGTNQHFIYFNNGARQNVASVTNGIKAVNTDFHIGCPVNNASNALAGGRVDEVGFWKNRVLSATDVAALFNGGAALPFSSFTT